MSRRNCGACIIFNPQGDVLMGVKIKHSAWEFPGGKLDGDEQVKVGALRELQEETGLIVPDLDYVGYYDRHPKWLVHLFTGVHRSDDIQPTLMEPDKHLRWEWIRAEEVTQKTIAEFELTEVCKTVIVLGFLDAARKAAFQSGAYEGLVAR